jgi:hypothetical protein
MLAIVCAHEIAQSGTFISWAESLGHDDFIRLHLNEKAAGKNHRQSALQKRSIADRRAEQALLPYVFEAGGDRGLEIIYGRRSVFHSRDSLRSKRMTDPRGRDFAPNCIAPLSAPFQPAHEAVGQPSSTSAKSPLSNPIGNHCRFALRWPHVSPITMGQLCRLSQCGKPRVLPDLNGFIAY